MANNVVTGSYDYNAICDVCGFKKKASELRLRWDGMRVCKEDWEMRHVADFYQTRNDVHKLPFTRPDSDAARTTYLKLGTATETSDGVWTTTNNYSISGTPSADWCNTLGLSQTVMAWVKMDYWGAANQSIIANCDLSSIGTWRLSINGGNAQSLGSGIQPIRGVMSSVSNGSVAVNTPSINNVLSPGRWHHVAWVRNGTLVSDTLYVDGNPVSSIKGLSTLYPVNTPAVNNTDLIYLGMIGSSTSPFVGSLSDVRVFNTALSQQQVRWNMANAPTMIGSTYTLPEPSGYLKAWYKLDDNSTTTISDSSGNANHLTINTATDVSWVNKGIY